MSVWLSDGHDGPGSWEGSSEVTSPSSPCRGHSMKFYALQNNNGKKKNPEIFIASSVTVWLFGDLPPSKPRIPQAAFPEPALGPLFALPNMTPSHQTPPMHRPGYHQHPRSHMATLQLPASLEPVAVATEALRLRW